MINFDARELAALSVALPKMGATVQKATTKVFEEAAAALTEKWRENAKESSGKHGRLYPLSITWEQKVSTSLDFEVGPESAKPQGGMGPGFEFGSTHQPPHLDGQRAADGVVPPLEARFLGVAAGALDA